MLDLLKNSWRIPSIEQLKTKFDLTVTYKKIKFITKQEGFEPEKINDPHYVFLPVEAADKPITTELYQDILLNKYKL